MRLFFDECLILVLKRLFVIRVVDFIMFNVYDTLKIESMFEIRYILTQLLYKIVDYAQPNFEVCTG